MKEIDVTFGTFANYQALLNEMFEYPEATLKDTFLTAIGLSQDDGFTIEIGNYSQNYAQKTNTYFDICHKGRVLFHICPYNGSFTPILIQWGPYSDSSAYIRWASNVTPSFHIYLFTNNLLVMYQTLSTGSASSNFGTFIPPCKTPLTYKESRYDMFSVKMTNDGPLGTQDYWAGSSYGNINYVLSNYYCDVITGTNKQTKTTSSLTIRDFILCDNNLIPHVVEDMWAIVMLPTALLTQKFIKLNGTKHMIIRVNSADKNTYCLLANTGEPYEGSNINNSW